MDKPQDSKKAKDRSPVFPFIPLARAIERAKQVYDEERRGAAPYTRIVLHWKYSEASSGALQTVSALKSYGLLREVGGSGLTRQLQLTDLALRILLDQREDSTDRDAYMREAALTPAIASEVHERWPDGLPSDSTLNHFLVLERKFSQTSAFNVVKILKENQQVISSHASDVSSQNQDEENDDVKDTANKTNEQTEQQKSDKKAAATAVAAGTKITLVHEGVEITLLFNKWPTAATFEFLEKYAIFQKGFAIATPAATPVATSDLSEDAKSFHSSVTQNIHAN